MVSDGVLVSVETALTTTASMLSPMPIISGGGSDIRINISLLYYLSLSLILTEKAMKDQATGMIEQEMDKAVENITMVDVENFIIEQFFLFIIIAFFLQLAQNTSSE
jgi:hypothetical protein